MINHIKKISVLFILFGLQTVLGAGNGNGGGGNVDPCEGLAISYQPALILMNDQNNVAQLLTVSRTATSGTCNFLVFIENIPGTTDTDRHLTQGNDTIPIQFYTTAGHANIVKSAAGAGSSAEAMSGSITGSATSANVYYYPYINTSLIVAPSSNNPYIDRYDFSLYTWNGNSFNNKTKITTNASTNYKYQIDSSMSLSLVNDGSLYNAADVTQTLDFGTLTTGESLGFDLWLVYTNGYKLSLSSTNGGNLKNTAVASSNLVPYTLSLDNVNVTLSSAETVVKTGTGASPSGGTKVDVTATIGNVGTVFAGTYNDYVTFKIAAP